MKTFYSNGKLLLTGEYIVLDGAKALAIPTKHGQSLTISAINAPQLKWESIDDKGNIWFKNSFSLEEILTNSYTQNNTTDDISKRLIQILKTANNLNISFLSNSFKKGKGLKVTSKLDFPKNWGLGSSSTLLNNIAKWANIDAFKLSEATFGGSGYDIACAQIKSPIIYSLTNGNSTIQLVNFSPSYKSKLFFVHLNKKQDSRASIKTYHDNKNDVSHYLKEINRITEDLIKTTSLNSFEQLLEKHEILIGEITHQTPVKELLFSDYKNAIKSLGGWGGDFILVTGDESYVRSYFNKKGYKTILSYEEMVL